MCLSIEKKVLFSIFFISLTFSSGLVHTLHAQETVAASFNEGYGKITLAWDHALVTLNVLAFSEVNVNTEKYEQGLAIANAAAETSGMLGDTSAAGTLVAAQSITLDSKGLADSQGTAQSFFYYKTLRIET